VRITETEVSLLDSLIDKIIEIDGNARVKVDSAEQTAREILSAAKQKRDEIGDKYKGQAEKRLATVLREYSRFADEEIRQIEKKQNERAAKIEETMRIKSPEWKKEIISGILGACV
jgi:vacuolar-type H+-ATPase subunit H